jgi:hypothetical protein
MKRNETVSNHSILLDAEIIRASYTLRRNYNGDGEWLEIELTNVEMLVKDSAPVEIINVISDEQKASIIRRIDRRERTFILPETEMA